MGTDTLSLELTPVEDPNATRWGVTTDNNRSVGVFNGVFQAQWNLMEYLSARLAELIGTPIKVSGISAATDKVTTANAHGLSGGDVVRFVALNGGSLPAEITGGAGYVLADTSTTFKVAESSGGPAIDITSAGSGDIYAFKVPDVLGTLFTASGAGLEGGLSDLLVTIAGAQTITGAKIVDDLTVSGTNALKLAARDVTRAMNGLWINQADGTLNKGTVLTLVGGTLDQWAMRLDLPHGQTLKGVAVNINPTNVVALPGTMPQFAVWSTKIDGTDAAFVSSLAIDSSGSTGAYNAAHDISVSGLSIAIDRSQYVYYLVMSGSSGATPANDIIVNPPRVTVSVSSMKDWA